MFLCFFFKFFNLSEPTDSDKISQTTVLRIEPIWENNSAPALIKTKEIEGKHEPNYSRTDETKTLSSTNKVNLMCVIFKMRKISTEKLSHSPRQIYPQATDLAVTKAAEFQQTKSLDFEAKGLNCEKNFEN